MNKYLITLPSTKSYKGFSCGTLLVKAESKEEAEKIVKYLKPHSIIGIIKKVNY